jgi:hypothetical protein
MDGASPTAAPSPSALVVAVVSVVVVSASAVAVDPTSQWWRGGRPPAEIVGSHALRYIVAKHQPRDGMGVFRRCVAAPGEATDTHAAFNTQLPLPLIHVVANANTSCRVPSAATTAPVSKNRHKPDQF